MGNGNILEENFWAFGQALATAMLGLLVFSAIETYIGQIDIEMGVNLLILLLETRRKMKRDASSNDPPPSDNASTKSPECPVHGTGALKPTPNNNSNAALQSSGISEARQITPMDRDIADESTVASLTQGPQQIIPRSWTAYSSEERATGEENIHLNATTRTNPSSPLAAESTAPHKANYYEKSWYIVLAMFQYLQVLSVSGCILSGAYNSKLNDTNFSGHFGSDNDVLSIFLHLTNWITVWAPLSSLIMTLPYTLPAKKPAIFRKWLLSPRRSRAWLITKQVIIFCIAEFFSVDTLIGQPISPPLEIVLTGLLLPIFVLAGAILVYAPWYINISSKLRRESRASRVAPGPGPGR